MQITTECQVCGKELATTQCRICGKAVCEQCIQNGVCRACMIKNEKQ